MGSADTDRMYMCIDLKSFLRVCGVCRFGAGSVYDASGGGRWVSWQRGYYIGHFTGLKKARC